MDTRKGEDMVLALALANTPETQWVWIIWIVIAGLTGAFFNRWIQAGKLGIVGTIIMGIFGSLIGGFTLSLFEFSNQSIVWTSVMAFLSTMLAAGATVAGG
jgi:uncharacterized membrane protein YeaQ/YmgE (transglycosylase-associated protein family)